MTLPQLIVVGGSPGSGKTTLAHEIARAVPCPAICRDEIKEGLAHADASYEPVLRSPLAKQAYETFFNVLKLLIDDGVSLVAEAAFQHKLWAPRLEPLGADIRIVQCMVDPNVARERIVRRATEDPLRSRAHPDAAFLEALDDGTMSLETYEALHLDVPTLHVDTMDGYDPPLEAIVAFAAR